jgi:hypothetical protein
VIERNTYIKRFWNIREEKCDEGKNILRDYSRIPLIWNVKTEVIQV